MSGTVVGSAAVVQRVRAFFAPVDRVGGVPAIFDPAVHGRFDVAAGLAGWTELGDVRGFARTSGTAVAMERSGSPLMTMRQVRTAVDATVRFAFDVWGKLQMGLSCGSQHMNLLQTVADASANGSGGVGAFAVPLQTGSTAAALTVGAVAAAGFAVGDMVAVDVDYTGQTGYVGSGISAAFVKSADAVRSDLNYVRRVSYNIGLVTGVANGVLTLSGALPAGVPAAAMKVAKVLGFVDREGGSFFQEWSAVFVMDGTQGERLIYHYPRLQAATGAAEQAVALAKSGLEDVRLECVFRALPVMDANDGEAVVCFRSYLPAPMREV